MKASFATTVRVTWWSHSVSRETRSTSRLNGAASDLACSKSDDGYGYGAPPRPNAYVPTDEKSLGVPQPYGKFAPFKPTDVAGNLRHYRKPTASTIDE